MPLRAGPGQRPVRAKLAHVTEHGIWSRARLATDDGREVSLDLNGDRLRCTVPASAAEPATGATSFGLLAGALSSCTAMSVRTFLQRWHLEPAGVAVEVAFDTGSPPVMHREVTVEAALDTGEREQLATVVDATPVTVLLQDSLIITTRIVTGPAPDSGP